jgi:hypothetical protein
MVQHRWNDRQLQALEDALKTYNFVPDQVRALRGDRAFANALVDRLAHRGERAKILAQMGPTPGAEAGENALSFALIAWGPSGWVRQNQRVQGAWFQDVIEECLGATNQAAERRQSAESITEKWTKRLGPRTPYNQIARLLASWPGTLSHRALWAQTAVNLARTACALERYRLAHGEYPARLDALVPQFLAGVPPDFYSGGSLKYRQTDIGQFVLYSVGRNQTDDGGTAQLNKTGTENNHEQGDWVWQFPAK